MRVVGVVVVASFMLGGGCAPALTRVPDAHPARATAASTPLPTVGAMLESDTPAAAPAPAASDPHHGHHGHHGHGHKRGDDA